MKRFHGLTSIILIYTSFIIGLIYTWRTFEILGIVYGLVLFASPFILTYAYCAKCPCRYDNCGHIIPGKLAQIFPIRKQSKYLLIDYLALLIPVAFLIATPLFIIYDRILLMLVFVLLIAIGIAEIRTVLCRNCSNKYCPLTKNESLKYL
jgi:hypothetical protein